MRIYVNFKVNVKLLVIGLLVIGLLSPYHPQKPLTIKKFKKMSLVAPYRAFTNTEYHFMLCFKGVAYTPCG